MDRLTSMAVFVRTVERGGFAAAASELGLSPTMTGLHVRALEERLGARLLNRTTRRQSLTEAGRRYYERCKQILADIEAAEGDAMDLQSAPRGRLRVTAPISFGTHALTPAIIDYLALYPEVEVDLSLNDRVIDLVDEGYEVALRVGPLADSSLIARKLAPYRLRLCASPEYLRRRGVPRRVEDLADHNCLCFVYARSGSEWRFTGPEGESEVAIRGRLQTNNGDALRLAARRGLGIILQPAALLAEDIASGALVPLLAGHVPPSFPMHIVYLPDRWPTPKVRSFVDFVVERFGERSERLAKPSP
jgi:DNA-binding transcriptional LysR family regulator